MVHMWLDGDKVYVRAPFSEQFVAEARNLQGRYEKVERRWAFHAEDVDVLSQKLMDVYGENGLSEVERVTVEVELDMLAMAKKDHLELFGYTLVKRFHRNAPVKLGEGVIVKEGGFPARLSGERRPLLQAEKGTVLRVKHVPLVSVEREMARGMKGISVVDTTDNQTILADMATERERLQQRIDEIDGFLHA